MSEELDQDPSTTTTTWGAPPIDGAAALADLTGGGGVHEPSLEDLIGDRGGDTPPPTGIDVLTELAGATPEGQSATDAYGYNKELAEQGKWFRWSKLGPAARVKLAKVGNKVWRQLSDRARERYGGDDGAIKPATMDRIIEPMMAKSIFIGMEGVVVEVGAEPLTDTVENRLRLLELFSPDLRNDLFKVANNPKNFRDLSEEVLGN